jgi:hypothetical protein
MSIGNANDIGCLDVNVATGVHGILIIEIPRIGAAVSLNLKRLVVLLSTFADEGTTLYFKYASYCKRPRTDEVAPVSMHFPKYPVGADNALASEWPWPRLAIRTSRTLHLT